MAWLNGGMKATFSHAIRPRTKRVKAALRGHGVASQTQNIPSVRQDKVRSDKLTIRG